MISHMLPYAVRYGRRVDCSAPSDADKTEAACTRFSRELHTGVDPSNDVVNKSMTAGRVQAVQPPRSSGNAALEGTLESDVLVDKPDVKWADVVGLEGAKQALQEAVVLPTIRSDLFRVRLFPMLKRVMHVFLMKLRCTCIASWQTVWKTCSSVTIQLVSN